MSAAARKGLSHLRTLHNETCPATGVWPGGHGPAHTTDNKPMQQGIQRACHALLVSLHTHLTLASCGRHGNQLATSYDQPPAHD
jgi:hypothetical protein